MNSRRTGDSTLVVTFCNVRKDRPSVAAVDLTAEPPKLEWIEIREGAHLRGARGLCAWNDLVCVAHEWGPRNGLPAGFVLLDPARGFRQVAGADLPLTPHSVCSRGDDLYFTMSARDSVYRAAPDESGRWTVSRHWTLPGSSGQSDENHVNGIDVVDGSLWISAAGKKEAGSLLWASAKRGFVYDVDRSRLVKTDIRHPHSLLNDGGTVWTCETRGSRILSMNGEEYRLPGDEKWRVRGLAMSEEHVYFGLSKNRIGSKSQGSFRGYEGACRIYRLSRRSAAIEVLLDLSDLRHEIYELMLS